MLPLPLPVAALVIVNHGALLVAVQLQPAFVVIENVPDATSDPTDTLAGDSAYVHGAAACETVTIWPPTAMVPLRVVELGLTPTV